MIVCQIFPSPKVKQSSIISNKHGIYELSYEMLNDLNLESSEILKGQKNLKTSWNYHLAPSPPPKNKNFVDTSKKLLKIEIKTFPHFSITLEN